MLEEDYLRTQQSKQQVLSGTSVPGPRHAVGCAAAAGQGVNDGEDGNDDDDAAPLDANGILDMLRRDVGGL